MPPLQHALEAWLVGAEAKLNGDSHLSTDFQQLREIIHAATLRQRLLYLHTKAPSLYAPVIGMAQHEPVAGQKDTLRTRTEWPYETVHDAIVAGWQVIQFPQLLAPFDDRELDYVGFEFILQKMEVLVND